MTEDRRAPIELRDAGVGDVNFSQRIITVIAVPYEQPTKVPYRGDVWDEVFHRGSMDGIEKRPNRVRANRDHDKTRTVGKVVNFWPQRDEGLVAEIRIAQTPLGDETLALADEDMLSSSVGFGVLPENQRLDRATKVRHINKAYLDHLSFVEAPAYAGAQVIGVRSESGLIVPEQSIATPNLDQFTADELWRWASERKTRS